MNLQGSITELQDNVLQLYARFELHYRENQIIRDLWNAMAQDVSKQKRSMNALPLSFWTELKKYGDGLPARIAESAKRKVPESDEESSLRTRLEQVLEIEEPAILNIYVPLISRLRKNWTDQALDFYIIVKAHLARIASIMEQFSGDPKTVQRAHLLLDSFEKAVQTPQEQFGEPRLISARQAKGTKQDLKSAEAGKSHPSKKTEQTRSAVPPLAKRTKAHHGRSKPLVKMVKKITLRSRRRASR